MHTSMSGLLEIFMKCRDFAVFMITAVLISVIIRVNITHDDVINNSVSVYG